MAKTLEPVTDENGDLVVTYLGLDYVVAMGTVDEEGNFVTIFDNFESKDVAEGKISNAQVTMAFYTGEVDEDGNKLTTTRVVKADIMLSNDVPRGVDDFNGIYKPYNYNLGTSPEEQGASPFTVTVTVKDGAGTDQKAVTLPLYFGYIGSTQSGETA